MQFSVTGRHVEITDAMRQYVEEKVGKLTRFYDRIESIDVVVEHAAGKNQIELVARLAHKHTLLGQVAADNYYEAIDLVVDKLERQLKKHKEKVRNRKHVAKPGQMPEEETEPEQGD